MPFLQAGQLLVQVDEAGGHPGDVGAAGFQFLYFFHNRVELVPDLLQAVPQAPVGHRQHFLLRQVQHGVDFDVKGGGQLVDLGAGQYHGPAAGVFGHHLGVILHVGRRRDEVQQVAQKQRPPDALQITGPLQDVADGHRVDGLPAVIELGDRPEDDLMGRYVEVLRAQRAHHFVGGPRGAQDRPQHRLFGFQAVRRGPVRPGPFGHRSVVHVFVFLHPAVLP